ncbi:MAG: hypothetical protein E6J61_10285 [Deltaproteobacteria bacterium]|nr:MAG: hypothetical protein E6J61_10285 [Deltaproteobacteria bacterium]
MIAVAAGEALGLLWGPGLVFLVFIIWLIRRVVRAARTESRLEEERLREWMKGEVAQLQSTKAEPRLMRVPTAAERKKRSAVPAPAAPEAVPGPDVITIVKVVDGKVVGKWQFG